jgi:hypothetical protein
MLKLIKKWIKESRELNAELNEMGLYFHYTPYGAYIVHITCPEKTEHINTIDDKLRRI